MSAPRKRFWRSSAARRMGGAYSATPRSTKPDWLRDKKINVLLVTALEPSADFPGVPAVIDLVSKEDDRQLLTLMAGASATWRPFAAPPRPPPQQDATPRRAVYEHAKKAAIRAPANQK